MTDPDANAVAQGEETMGEPEAATEEDPQEDQLNKAIEELRGVLHEDGEAGDGPAVASGGNSSIILGIPVEVQIVLGSIIGKIAHIEA